MSDLCGEWSSKSVDMVTGEVRAGVIWCKSWHCEYCAPIRQRQLMRQAADGSPNKFITLTSRLRPDSMSPDAAARQLVHAWRMVIQRAKREGFFSDIQYIAVFELTKNDWPHLHILARCSFLPQSWLSLRMSEYCDSPIVDIRSVKSAKRAAWYVAKYTSKAPEKFSGCKRYWRTLKYDLSESKSERPVHEHRKGYLSQNDIHFMADLYSGHGYEVEWDSEHSFTAWPGQIDFYSAARRSYWRKHDPPYKEKYLWTSH